MSCFLFKLRFTAPVHFGASDAALSLCSSAENICADTLFSALCHTALRAEGQPGLSRLLDAARRGELRLSDTMPWRGDTLYLPKPFFHSEVHAEVPAARRKAMKKLRWIPVGAFEDFSASVHGGEQYIPDEDAAFGVHAGHTRAAVTGGEDAIPYQVGTFRFYDDCGLWFICCCPEADGEYYARLVTLLGVGGVGGKVSTGCGSFEVEDFIFLDEPFDAQTEWLNSALNSESARYLLLTTALPADGELDGVLDGAFCQLVRRGGFVQSENYAAVPQKKATQYFLAVGSVLPRRFDGALWQVGGSGEHPVYRYSSPVLLGVSL